MATLTHKYTGEANCNDTVGTAHGSISSGTVAYVTGKIGKAFDFGLGTGRIAAPVTIPASGPFSISLWFMLAHYDSVYNMILSAGNSASRWYITLCPQYFAGVSFYPDATHNMHSNEALTPGVWHHLALTGNPGVGNYLMYINGVLKATLGGWSLNTDTMVIGGAEGDYYLSGKLDEIGIYSDMLTQGEITALAAETPALLMAISSGHLITKSGKLIAK